MPAITHHFAYRLGNGNAPKKDALEELFTGVYEKFKVTAGPGEEQNETLIIIVDEKGLPIAVTLGGHVLPFTKMKVTREQVATYARVYARGVGRILGLVGERPKGR